MRSWKKLRQMTTRTAAVELSPSWASALFVSAVGCYAANTALGILSAAGRVDARSGWVHHALYVVTSVLTASALSTALWANPKKHFRRAAALLLPAAVPLALIPFADARSVRHPIIALTAAPFLIAGAVRAFRREPYGTA